MNGTRSRTCRWCAGRAGLIRERPAASAWTIRRLLIALILPLGAPPLAYAECTITTTSVTFGIYDVFTTSPLDSTGTITYRCSAEARNIQITLTRGNSATFQRYMIRSGGGDTLDYNLYSDAARTIVWGDGTAGTGVYFDPNLPPKLGDVIVTIYGRIPGGQDVGGGGYTDLVTAIVNF